MNLEKFYTEHRGIWYKYVPEQNVWRLSDREDANGIIGNYNATMNRLDECLEIFKYDCAQHYQKHYNKKSKQYVSKTSTGCNQ
jgi:hypothetical protein